MLHPLYDLIEDDKTAGCRKKLVEGFSKEDIQVAEQMGAAYGVKLLPYALFSAGNLFAAKTLVEDFGADLMANYSTAKPIPVLFMMCLSCGALVAEQWVEMCDASKLISYRDSEEGNVFTAFMTLSQSNKHDPSRMMRRIMCAIQLAEGKAVLTEMLLHADCRGVTPLMLAAAGRSCGTLELLLEMLGGSLDVDAVDCDGDTALHYAVMKGRAQNAAILLLRGSDPHKKNKNQVTPITVRTANENVVSAVESVVFHLAFQAMYGPPAETRGCALK